MSADWFARLAARKRGSVSESIGKFAQMEQQLIEDLKKDPDSKYYVEPKYDKTAADYGRPPPGSKTERRGIKAGVHICREILFLMEKIDESADGEEPHKYISFGKFFPIYSMYSDKLVGMLIRARKYGLLTFDGEMLYQRQDDNKLIVMMMSIDEIRKKLRPSGDPVHCVTLADPDD